jgi:hypothetical protein
MTVMLEKITRAVDGIPTELCTERTYCAASSASPNTG